MAHRLRCLSANPEQSETGITRVLWDKNAALDLIEAHEADQRAKETL
jgi:hypothetical protein